MTLALILFVFVAFAGGMAVNWYFSAERRGRQLLARTEISRIGDFPQQGVGRVVGKVVEVVGEPLISPASGKACAYFSFAIRERRGGKNKYWATLFSASEARDFWIEDASGRALVHALAGATWVVVKDVHGQSGTFDDPSPDEDALFRRYGIDPQGLLGWNKTLEFFEQSVELGEVVSVLGVGHREVDTSVAGPGYREPGQRLVISQEGEIVVVVSDEPEHVG